MSAHALLPLALAALLLPPGLGAASTALAFCLGARRLELAGLSLLVLAASLRPASGDEPESRLVAEAPLGTSSPVVGVPSVGRPSVVGPAAVRLVGRWRAPPGSVPHLATAAGPVALALAEDLAEPPPGTEISVLARCADDGRATAVALDVVGPPRGAWLDRWLVAARGRIRYLVRGERRGLVEALLLGRRADLEASIELDCRRTGTLHLLALSGQHIVFVAGLLTLAAAPFCLARGGPLLVALLLFGLLAGSQPPVVRSLVAWALARAGLSRGRSGSGLYRLGVVALVIAAAEPTWVDDLGARLSFLAVAGLVVAQRLGGPLAAPWGAFLATAPLCVEVFGELQPWGVLVTPLLVPPMVVALGCGLATVLTGSLLSPLDGLTAPLLDGSAAVLRWTLAGAGALVPAPLYPPPLPGSGAAWGVALVAALGLLGRRQAWRELP